ncbi:hypothetical protein MUY14_43085 [Amycolatopsis sp. FBCC-B4732]|uniref:hypothetical protein n=1 Tax=Amycolatopsis sp. FBCC-B4732 TaxID=3079339 RepID=UPI001FF46C2D|nr:hypothetical protein [Amycolatopsis sp. FBCC-B4732]UOX88397.1 hypothetical protein MUY14_43085 [Amycolatopsis sp. FBCC-B4732]
MLTRAPAVGGVIAALLLSSAVSASAGGWGSVDCAQESSPYCELGAGKTGKAPGGGDRVPDAPSPKGGGGKATPPPGDRIVGGNSPAASCSYVRSNFQPPATGVQTVVFRGAARAVPPVVLASVPLSRARGLGAQQGGAWYVYRCTSAGFRDGLYRVPIWLPDGAAPAGARLPSPQELAEQARTQLRLPSPSIEANPAGDKLVSLPTWLWLDRGNWGTQQATAAVPGVTVTAVATPKSVSWLTGDGDTVNCSGRGTPFTPGGDASAASPDCGHTYRRSSATAPAQLFPVRATIHWTITWSGAGQSGTFRDLTTSASAAFRVAEIQALGTGHR